MPDILNLGEHEYGLAEAAILSERWLSAATLPAFREFWRVYHGDKPIEETDRRACGDDQEGLDPGAAASPDRR